MAEKEIGNWIRKPIKGQSAGYPASTVCYSHPRSMPFSLVDIPDVRSSTSIGCPSALPVCFCAGLGFAFFFFSADTAGCGFDACSAFCFGGCCVAVFDLLVALTTGSTFCITTRAARAWLRRSGAAGVAVGAGACLLCTTATAGFEESAFIALDCAEGCGWGVGGEGDAVVEEGAGSAALTCATNGWRMGSEGEGEGASFASLVCATGCASPAGDSGGGVEEGT